MDWPKASLGNRIEIKRYKNKLFHVSAGLVMVGLFLLRNLEFVTHFSQLNVLGQQIVFFILLRSL